MWDGQGAGQWDEGWEGPRLEYTGFRTWDPVVWSRLLDTVQPPGLNQAHRAQI